MDPTSAKRLTLELLIALGSELLENAVEDPLEHLDEEWMVSILDGVSIGALRALASRKLLEQDHVEECVRLFDYTCVDEHHILDLMVPGQGYELAWCIGVSLTQETVSKLKCGHFVKSADRWDYLDSLVKPKAQKWIEWCLQHNPEMKDCLCSLSAKHGHLELLQWAKDQGCSWNGLTPATAAQYGHLFILQWAVDHGCPWDQRCIFNSMKNGHHHVAEWARDNKCPYDATYEDRPTMFIADFRDDHIPNDDLGFWGFFFRAFGRPRNKRRNRRVHYPVHYPRRSYPPRGGLGFT